MLLIRTDNLLIPGSSPESITASTTVKLGSAGFASTDSFTADMFGWGFRPAHARMRGNAASANGRASMAPFDKCATPKLDRIYTQSIDVNLRRPTSQAATGISEDVRVNVTLSKNLAHPIESLDRTR